MAASLTPARPPPPRPIRVRRPCLRTITRYHEWGRVKISLRAKALLAGAKFLAKNHERVGATTRDVESLDLTAAAHPLQDAATLMVETGARPRSVLGKKLEKLYTDLTATPSDAWMGTIEEMYRNVRTWTSKYKEIRRKYLSVIEGFTKDSSRYFEDAQKNLATLKETAQDIKERAIEPSFDLLARTSEQLRAVKDEISLIRFT